MTLVVYTARVTYAGPDRLDVTRKTGVGHALAFAPSWKILGPMIKARRARERTGRRAAMGRVRRGVYGRDACELPRQLPGVGVAAEPG